MTRAAHTVLAPLVLIVVAVLAIGVLALSVVVWAACGIAQVCRVSARA